MAIYFYRANESYGYLSNFSSHSVVIDDQLWATTEHYFQAQKFNDIEYKKQIQRALTPGESKKLGSTRRYKIRDDWENVKEDIMYKALHAKFTQHQNLKQKLLQTGDKELIEHTVNDKYWADGGNGNGKNRLGILLMRLREELKG